MFTNKNKIVLPHKELLNWTQVLSTLLIAKMELYQAMLFCQQSLHQKKSKQFVSELAQSLREGKSFKQSLEASSFKLPDLYLGMVSIGEKSASLGSTLLVLQQHLIGEKRLRDKLLSALIYPAMVLIVMLLGSFSIAIFIIPSLIEATQSIQLGDNNLAESLHQLKAMQITVMVLISFVIIMFAIHKTLTYQISRYSYHYHRLKLRFLPLSATITYAHFSFYMKSLLNAGVRLEQALLEILQLIPNLFIVSEVKEIHLRIMKGNAPEYAFDLSAFPSEFSLWLAVSHKTGDSISSFDLLHRYYEEKFEQEITRFTALIDPILILIIGVLLIFFIIYFIAPFFNQLTELVTFF